MSPTVLHPSGTVSYEEPSLVKVLTLISFVYLLSVARTIADYVLGAGLLGEIAVGVIYGPVSKILSVEVEHTLLALGYIGLILIVFEGGLTLDLASFVPLLPLSLISALTGILLPLALTFALFSCPSFHYLPLQAFTAGSALASTSLGTTFFVLKSTRGGGFERTRIAQVLKGAALADDVVALVLLSVISSLATGQEEGGGGRSNKDLGWTIGRPIVASVAMCTVTPIVILYVLRPLFGTRRIKTCVEQGGKEFKLFLGVVVLSAYLSIAYYAGTTVLLGAFLAGVTLPFLSPPSKTVSFLDIYEHYIVPLQTYVLVPFFFGSIGYSIPFLQLWRGTIVWKGIVYSLLMMVGKFLVGVCIVANDSMSRSTTQGGGGSTLSGSKEDEADEDLTKVVVVAPTTLAERSRPPTLPTTTSASPTLGGTRADTAKSRSLFLGETLPAAIFLGSALIARGEIGILVLQVAYNSNTPSSSSATSVLSTEPYLVSIWAVLLCTIVGPVGFAQLVKSRWAREGILNGRWA